MVPMKRCVVNVATDGYVPMQQRLVGSLAGFPALTFSALPPGSPSHEDVPYGFKVFALREAVRLGCSSLLWLDAPCVATAPIDPLFGRIERDGYFFISDGAALGAWAHDDCLKAFGLSREDALKLPLMNGAVIGLDVSHPLGRRWLDEWSSHLALFRGPYLSSEGFVSQDPRCRGHRHDEAVGSCVAHKLGLQLRPGSELREISYRPAVRDASVAEE